MENPKKQNGSEQESVVAGRSSQQQIPLFSSPELFGDKNEIMICHKGEVYKIRITRNDKLIMNK